MKQFAVTIGILTIAFGAFGQGSISFNNRAGVDAPIYGPNPLTPLVRQSGQSTTNTVRPGPVDYAGYPLLAGTGFTAELWALNPVTSAFEPLAGPSAKVGFRTGTVAGFILNQAAAVIVPWVTVNNTPQSYQVRAWNNNGGTLLTWSQVMAQPTFAQGISDTFQSPTVTGVNQPGPIVGLNSFNLTIVPEPGVIALGVLGLGALLLRRRK